MSLLNFPLSVLQYMSWKSCMNFLYMILAIKLQIEDISFIVRELFSVHILLSSLIKFVGCTTITPLLLILSFSLKSWMVLLIFQTNDSLWLKLQTVKTFYPKTIPILFCFSVIMFWHFRDDILTVFELTLSSLLYFLLISNLNGFSLSWLHLGRCLNSVQLMLV